VIGILGIVAGIGMFNGRLTVKHQEEGAFLNSLKQIFWRGATTASSRGKTYKLHYDGQKLEVIPAGGGDAVYEAEVPPDVSLTLQPGDIAEFTAPGRVKNLALPGDCNGPSSFTVHANGKTYCYRVSLIGEVEVTEQ